MADDRPVGDVVDELAALRKMVDDMRATLSAQASRCPTGVIVGSLLASLPDTLPLDGRTVSRVTYAVLWKWISDNGFVAAGVFGAGDGSTTFVLPDVRDRVIKGTAATGEAVGALLGANTKTIATTNLPSHLHSIGDDGQHQHDFLTAQGGAHGGHFPGDQFNVPSGATYGLAAWNSGGVGSGTHNHSGTTAFNSNHNHGTATGSTGGGTAFDVRQASFNLNYLIYT